MKTIIGITGGIASGKSNITNVIKNEGYPVLNCDEIDYELSQIDRPLYNVIKKTFGDNFIKPDKSLDRKKLGKLIFKDKKQKELLNYITHPIIKDELLKRIDEIDSSYVFVEIPLLYEAKFDDLCNYVIVAYLSKKEQIIRLMNRDLIDEDFALEKIHSQMDLYEKRLLADFVVETNGTFEETKAQVLKILDKIMEK